jgi:hypothetical protein
MSGEILRKGDKIIGIIGISGQLTTNLRYKAIAFKEWAYVEGMPSLLSLCTLPHCYYLVNIRHQAVPHLSSYYARKNTTDNFRRQLFPTWTLIIYIHS